MVQVRFINDTTPIEVTSETQETRVNVRSETQVKNIGVKSSAHHDDLTGRDLPDQHPIDAITGLRDALDTIPTDYVSDAELEAALLEKQDVIRDLSEIREGATLGATAVQPNDLESYATTDYVDDGLSGKQDTLTAGANIQIVGNTISATDTTYTAGTGIDITNDVISVTNAISTGAALGATALQSGDNISELVNNSGYITSADLPTNYVTTDTTQDITGLKTIKNQLKIQSGNADGALFIGADANATTLRNGTRKLARVNMPTNEDITLPMTIISGDTMGDGGSTIGQTRDIYNRIEFGGRIGAIGNTSPDGIAFCVATSHNSTRSKVYALEMEATQARFNVRPNYNGTDLALSSDIPTVNNPTITFTQGGTTKGTITLNQSGDQTIELDAGGSDVEAFTAAEVQAIWEAN